MFLKSLQRGMSVMMLIVSLLVCMAAYPANLALELKDINLSDAVRLLANFLHINVMISPNVQGVATLELRDADPEQAFNLLLTAHGLARWRMGNVWYIAPGAELIKRKQEELKWQEVSIDTAPLVTRVWQIHYAKADDIGRILQDEHVSFLSKRGRARVDTRTNIICIEDLAEQINNISRLIERLDVPVQQIEIEARLASVDNDLERELGIEFAIMPPDNAKASTNSAIAGRYSLAIVKLADSSLLDVRLAALENAGRAELISSPSLFTASQQTASIEAGEEVPYQETTQGGGTAVVFKKAVLGLKVTPQVLPGQNVLLQLQINQDRPSDKIVLGMPTISTRQIVTSILIHNGQTVVLGGIYETNTETGQQRVPFVSQLPLLGLLFKQQKTQENKRELLIFVTPKIITQES